MYGSMQRSVISLSITSEIERIKTNIANAYTELENKGATIPTEKNSNNLASTITTVTGGGGSIGSELCRQIAIHNPAKLIILHLYSDLYSWH